MTKREQRVINAFINCVERGEFSFEYACLLIEDNNKYGYLTDEAKEAFYGRFEASEEIIEGTYENGAFASEYSECPENTENAENAENAENETAEPDAPVQPTEPEIPEDV